MQVSNQPSLSMLVMSCPDQEQSTTCIQLPVEWHNASHSFNRAVAFASFINSHAQSLSSLIRNSVSIQN